MAGWEYKIVPAPTKGRKGKGVKGAEERFAFALESLMNDMAADGWEFQRAETLPSVERSGLTSSTTEWRNLLVFRRTVRKAADDFEPELLPAPEAVPVVAQTPDTPPDTVAAKPAAPVEASSVTADNGVESTSDLSGITTSLQKLAARRGEARDT